MNWSVSPSAPSLLVSESGQIVRMASSRRKGKGWQTFPEKELIPRRIGAGYLAIQCKIAGERLDLYVHRLVAEAFLCASPLKKEVNHRDGNKTNNHVSNLEWVTHSENHKHAAYVGLSGRTSLTPQQVISIRKDLIDGVPVVAIADKHGVTCSAIRHIREGRTWAWLDGDLTVMASKG
jgi:hypothetical protein